MKLGWQDTGGREEVVTQRRTQEAVGDSRTEYVRSRQVAKGEDRTQVWQEGWNGVKSQVDAGDDWQKTRVENACFLDILML